MFVGSLDACVENSNHFSFFFYNYFVIRSLNQGPVCDGACTLSLVRDAVAALATFPLFKLRHLASQRRAHLTGGKEGEKRGKKVFVIIANCLVSMKTKLYFFRRWRAKLPANKQAERAVWMRLFFSGSICRYSCCLVWPRRLGLTRGTPQNASHHQFKCVNLVRSFVFRS